MSRACLATAGNTQEERESCGFEACREVKLMDLNQYRESIRRLTMFAGR